MKTKALVVGSISYDIIFGVHGDIKNEIPLKNGKLESVNLMFTAKNKELYFGGTGGNIAYGLGLLGSGVSLFSVVGKDFYPEYSGHLEKYGVGLSVIQPEDDAKGDAHTANYYGISDEKYQQIGIWQPNVYGDHIEEVRLSESLTGQELESVNVAIFSPGTGISTRNHMLELRKKRGDDVLIIFDPSQVLSIFYDEKLLKECLSLADIVISNDVEIAQFSSVFGFSVAEILEMGVSHVIETMGEKGSVVYGQKETGRSDAKPSRTKIEIVKPKKVIETTGAGDAFRAGLVSGLLAGNSVEDSCKIGAVVGARSVEEYGGQGYKLSDEDLEFIKSI